MGKGKIDRNSVMKAHAKELILNQQADDWTRKSRFFYNLKNCTSKFQSNVKDAITHEITTSKTIDDNKKKTLRRQVPDDVFHLLSEHDIAQSLEKIDKTNDSGVCTEIAQQIFLLAQKQNTLEEIDKDYLDWVGKDPKLFTYIYDSLVAKRDKIWGKTLKEEHLIANINTIIQTYFDKRIQEIEKEEQAKQQNSTTNNKNTTKSSTEDEKDAEKKRKQENKEQQQQAEKNQNLDTMKNTTIPELKKFLQDNETYLHPEIITKWKNEITKGEQMLANKDNYNHEEIKKQFNKLNTAKKELRTLIEKQRKLKIELWLLCASLEWKLERLEKQGVLDDKEPVKKDIEQYITDIKQVIENDFVFKKTFLWISWQQGATMKSSLKKMDTMLDKYSKQLWKLEKDTLDKDKVRAKKKEQITTAQKKEERKRDVTKQIEEVKKDWYSLFWTIGKTVETFVDTAKETRKQKHQHNTENRKVTAQQKQATIRTKWDQERKDIRSKAKNARDEKDAATKQKIRLQEQKNKTAIAKEAVKTERNNTKIEQNKQKQEITKAKREAEKDLISTKKEKQEQVIDAYYKQQEELAKKAPLDTDIFHINTSPNQLWIIDRIKRVIKNIFSRKQKKNSNSENDNIEIITPEEVIVLPKTKQLPESTTT